MEALAPKQMRFEHGLMSDVQSNSKEIDFVRVCSFTFLRCVFDQGGVSDQIIEESLRKSGA